MFVFVLIIDFFLKKTEHLSCKKEEERSGGEWESGDKAFCKCIPLTMYRESSYCILKRLTNTWVHSMTFRDLIFFFLKSGLYHVDWFKSLLHKGYFPSAEFAYVWNVSGTDVLKRMTDEKYSRGQKNDEGLTAFDSGRT